MKKTLKLALAVFLGFTAIQTAHATDAVLTGDASVNTARTTTNYGTLSNLYVGNGYTSLLQFDLSVLPTGTTASQVSKATLWVYVNRVNTAGSVTLSPVSTAWNEGAVTYASLPTIGSSFTTFTASTPGTYVPVDVTSLVQGWVTTPSTNNGLALASAAANVLFDAKENDETAHVARLDITLASQGATGPIGLTGATGATGATGSQGVTGVMGAIGLTGATGAQGAQGVTGATGVTGNTGSTGATGVTGAVGVTGATGNTGATGATGNTGVIGATGVTGVTGATGVTGNTGATGATGIQGTTGVTGATGVTGSTGNTGATGATGSVGPVVAYNSATTYLNGQAVACVSTCSHNGSTYILTALSATNDDPSADPANWITSAAAGATGATGAAGATGIGLTVATGATGATGAMGAAVGGTYSASTAYVPGSVVTSGGTLYLAIANTTGNVPPNASYWVAAGGASGGSGGGGAFLSGTGYGNNSPAALTTIAGGLTGNITVLPLQGVGGYSTTMSGGTITTAPGFVQVLPAATTVTGISSTISLTNAMALVGSTVTLQAQLWKVPVNSSTGSPVPGAICALSPPFTGVLAIGTTASCSTTGLSVPLAAGDSGFIVISATAAGLSLVNTVNVDVSAAILTSGSGSAAAREQRALLEPQEQPALRVQPA